MKIGIVTIYDAFNYGSFLQAYAMQMFLESIGHTAEVLQCSKTSLFDALTTKYIAKTLKKTLIKNKRRICYSKDLKRLHTVKNHGQKYDVIIAGSDEIWNIKNSFEHCPEYFGYNLNADKIIAYAPSIGFCPRHEFLADLKAQRGIKNFDTIFARDESTKAVCERILNRKITEVCDPTILIYDMWEKIATMPLLQEKYVLYYSYGEKEKFKASTIKFAKERNLKLVSANFVYDWCDESLIVSPIEFLALMKNAEYVATTTFHGSVFASIFHKKFVTLPSGQKVTDYMTKIGLGDKIFADNLDYTDYESILDGIYSYDVVEKRHCDWKKNSSEHLIDALSEK